MAIILEGPDNAGKTTLSNLLSDKLKLPVFHSGGPPKNNSHAKVCCDLQNSLAHTNCVLDRITSISQQVYANRLNDPMLLDELEKLCNIPTNIIVYCRPSNEKLMDFSTHTVEEHDTEDHMAYVIENHQNIVSIYDRLMVSVPHLHYDWSSDINVDHFIKQLHLCINIPNYKDNILLKPIKL